MLPGVEFEKPTKAKQPPKSNQSARNKASSSRELRQLHDVYSKTQELYNGSKISLSISKLLVSKNRPTATRLLSLGLGSLKSTDQNRRIKQLVIFLAIAEQLRQDQSDLKIYAQDPSFSKTDNAFLESLGIHILSTPSATELGEAAQYINDSTLVYCPFLTLEAYQLLFSNGTLNAFIGDDFDELRIKWPKHSAGRNEAESVWRRFVQVLRKRKINGDDEFWEADDKPFPMAMYWNGHIPHSNLNIALSSDCSSQEVE